MTNLFLFIENIALSELSIFFIALLLVAIVIRTIYKYGYYKGKSEGK